MKKLLLIFILSVFSAVTAHAQVVVIKNGQMVLKAATVVAKGSSSGASMIPLQHKSVDAGSVATSSLAFTSSVTSGSTIVVCVFYASSGVSSVTVTDSVNAGNYSVAETQETDAGFNNYVQMFYMPNVAAGATTVHVSFNAAHEMAYAIVECPNTIAAPLDAHTYGTPATAGLTATSNTFTTAQASEVIIECYESLDTQTWSPQGGFTPIETIASNTNAGVAYLVTSVVITNGTESVNYTTSDTATMELASFK
jgi:uncharacterized membrane protein YjfL (UPF0719 family)